MERPEGVRLQAKLDGFRRDMHAKPSVDRCDGYSTGICLSLAYPPVRTTGQESQGTHQNHGLRVGSVARPAQDENFSNDVLIPKTEIGVR